MPKAGVLVFVSLIACTGSSAPPPIQSPHNTPPKEEPSGAREQVIKDAIAAITSGDIERLMALADPKAMFEYALSCKANDDVDLDVNHLSNKLRSDFSKAIEKSRGLGVEIVSIRNEARGWGGRRSRYASSDRNATFVSKGGSVSKSCTARTDLLFHEVDVKLNVTKGGDKRDARVRFDLVKGGGRWFLVKVPAELVHGGVSGVLVKMTEFQQRMCACKDKACADRVNEDMTKWGTEMARNASYDPDERPDPDLARRSADIMTKYTECMTKVMMQGAGGTP